MLVRLGNYTFKIRKCKDEDYRFVYGLLKKNMYALFVKHWGWEPERIRNDFKKENVKIIEYNKRRVAFYDLEFKKDSSHVNHIQVSKSMQGKGLGTFLMDLMEKETRKKGVKRINLKVFKENPARKLYLKRGYRQIKDEGPAVILEKRFK
jgi:GNAT superfamily N-acetyltransferase